MTIRLALNAACEALEQSGVSDSRLDAEYLLAHVLSLPRLAMRLQGGEPLCPEAEERFFRLVQRRIKREPLQYILGTQDFMGFSFRVDPRALIPRPETELLCEKAAAALAAFPAPRRALDLCCGSGALAVTLALTAANAQVEAADLSWDALALARENARRLGARVSFFQGDFLSAVSGRKYHVIVCNPPYIPSKDCSSLQPEVLREPVMALDGGTDGLDFYQRLKREAAGFLYPGGQVWVETGYDQAERVSALFRDGFARRTEIFQDLSGIPRMVLAQA